MKRKFNQKSSFQNITSPSKIALSALDLQQVARLLWLALALLMMNRSLPILAIVFSILSLILIKLSYSSWLVNDGVQTNISRVYAKGIQIFSSSVVDEEVSFISGNGFTEDKAIFITLGLAITLSVLSVVIGLISIYLKKHRQLSAIAASLGILGFGLIMFAVK